MLAGSKRKLTESMSNVSRQSIGTAGTAQLLTDSLKTCDSLLETAAEKVKANIEGFDEATLNALRDRIVSLSKESISSRYLNDYTLNVLETVLGEKGNGQAISLNDRGYEAVARQEINRRISDKTKSIDITKDPSAKRIRDLLKMGLASSSSVDEEFEVVEEGFKQSDSICPFTKQVYVEPMKSTKCTHHISRMALDVMLKGKQSSKCVVAGCAGIWTKSTSSLDEDFQFKLSRFLRKQASQGANNGREFEATELLDDDDNDEDNGYTQV